MLDNRDREVRAEGMTQASLFNPLPALAVFPQEVKGDAVMAAVLEAICAYSGPVVEARLTKKSLVGVLVGPGTDDNARVSAALDWIGFWPDNRVLAAGLIGWAARTLMNERKGAVHALAHALVAAGRLDDDEVNAVLASQTGHSRPANRSVPAWLRGWLSTLTSVALGDNGWPPASLVRIDSHANRTPNGAPSYT